MEADLPLLHLPDGRKHLGHAVVKGAAHEPLAPGVVGAGIPHMGPVDGLRPHQHYIEGGFHLAFAVQGVLALQDGLLRRKEHLFQRTAAEGGQDGRIVGHGAAGQFGGFVPQVQPAQAVGHRKAAAGGRPAGAQPVLVHRPVARVGVGTISDLQKAPPLLLPFAWPFNRADKCSRRWHSPPAGRRSAHGTSLRPRRRRPLPERSGSRPRARRPGFRTRRRGRCAG